MITAAVRRTIADDVNGARRRWAAAGIPSALPPSTVDDLEFVYRAEQECEAPSGGAGPRCRLAIVPKAPHGLGDVALVGMLARMIAFGASVHTVRRLAAADAGFVTRSLYPAARAGFRAATLSGDARAAIADLFDVPSFQLVHGVEFDPSMIMPAEVALARYGLSVGELMELWDDGRHPVERDQLVARYGGRAAELLLDGAPELDWFQTASWPIGIQRIRAGLMAFGLRHERLGNRPMILVNGHFAGLELLFADVEHGSTVIDVGIPIDLPVADFRRLVIGHSNDPRKCLAGTIRNDALTGELPWAHAQQPVSPRCNVVHCSDGPIAGSIELGRLLDDDAASRLRAWLGGRGYDAEEIAWLAGDLPICIDRKSSTLTGWTAGSSSVEALDFVARCAPPAFGSANGYGDGMSPHRWADAVKELRANKADTDAMSALEELEPIDEPPTLRDLAEHVEQGVVALGAGQVGLLVLAGGTGGRFGGYDLPEDHPRRQKALIPMFSLAGEDRSCLDVRVANARYWERRSSGSVPVTVLASNTSVEAITDWVDTHASDLRSRPAVLEQRSIPRLSLAAMSSDRDDVDLIARNEQGRPLGKPPGSFGLFGALCLSGLLREWLAAGVEYGVMANGDDIGARIQPAVVGLFETDPSLDAVIMCVPRGYRATTRDGRTLRGDASGWRVTIDGAPVDAAVDGNIVDRRHELGGALGRVRTTDGWHTVVAERLAGRDHPWFNTNQLVLRLSSLARALDAGDDPISGVRDARTQLPLFIEVKETVGQQVLQVFQPAADIVRLLGAVRAVQLNRVPGFGQVGGYTPIKRLDDVAFGQRMLSDASERDQLHFS